MSKEDLIPWNKRSKEEHRMLSARGGRNGRDSQAKKFASSLRELKKKGLTDKTAYRLACLVEDSDCSLIDLRKFIDSIDDSQLNFSQKVQLGNLIVSWHKAAHGEKIRSENLNISVDQAEFQRRVEEWEKRLVNDDGGNTHEHQ